MKLLIVDDEELTRTGVIQSIEWSALGIDEVLQADDGIHGVEAAMRHHPEIILCDIRMPRMDGIRMLEEIEKFLPDSTAIFMSGYSDKEYLMAAIKLRAINYIEKPLNPQEIREAVLEARSQHLQKKRSHQGESIHSRDTASQLALQLTVPFGTNRNEIRHLCEELSLQLTENTFFITYIVKLTPDTELSDLSKVEIFQEFSLFLSQFDLHCIYTEKRAFYMVYCVYGKTPVFQEEILSIGTFLSKRYALYGNYFAVAGDSCIGLSNAYSSYASAVILLQNSFFYPCNSLLTTEILKEKNEINSVLPLQPEETFHSLLTERKTEDCDFFLSSLYFYFNKNPNVIQNQVKDLYYKLHLVLIDMRKQKQLPITPESDNIIGLLEKCFYFHDLHQNLVQKTKEYFRDCETNNSENQTIVMIKDFISENYAKETLSVKDIGAHVFLSASYVCTFFKNETGKTLNQYLTEYRMEKAKKLLADPRYRITDISSQVGYSDGNYFGKSFKKYSGLSPSEFREKISS